MRGQISPPVRSSVNKPALNRRAPWRDPCWEPSIQEKVCRDREFSMQALVDKVMRAFTFKHPVSDPETACGRQDASEFAFKLLKNYRAQLRRRVIGPRRD